MHDSYDYTSLGYSDPQFSQDCLIEPIACLNVALSQVDLFQASSDSLECSITRQRSFGSRSQHSRAMFLLSQSFKSLIRSMCMCFYTRIIELAASCVYVRLQIAKLQVLLACICNPTSSFIAIPLSVSNWFNLISLISTLRIN